MFLLFFPLQGYGEELFSFAHCFREAGYKLQVYAFDYNSICCAYLQAELMKANFSEGDVIITVRVLDFLDMTVSDMRALQCHCCYTSAAINILFSLKMTFLAVCSGTIQYMICNNDHIQHLAETSTILSTDFKLFAEAHVDAGGQNRQLDGDEDTKRDVFSLKIMYNLLSNYFFFFKFYFIRLPLIELSHS